MHRNTSSIALPAVLCCMQSRSLAVSPSDRDFPFTFSTRCPIAIIGSDRLFPSRNRTTSVHSMDMEPPRCNVCLDLEWRRLPDDSGDGPWERRLKVAYHSTRNSKVCRICSAIANAISEFSQPPDKFRSRFPPIHAVESGQNLLAGWTYNTSSCVA